MTRSELASLYEQLRLVALPRGTDLNVRMAANTFNGWLKKWRPKMLQAAGYVAHGEAVPPHLVEDLQRAGTAADARREGLRKAFGIEIQVALADEAPKR